jgi:Flp pilus assembly protein TadG
MMPSSVFPAVPMPAASAPAGAAALEFALVFPIFLLFAAMIMENGILLVDQAFLDFATADAARLIRTGQVQQGSGETAFQNQLCADVTPLIACSGLQINVQSAANPGFGSLNATVQADADGNLATTSFTPGGPGDDVLVQVAYKRSYLFSIVGTGMSLVASTAVFQNEKYSGP